MLCRDKVRERLEGANVVPLAMSLVHLSGDFSVLDRIAPHVRGAWDHLESVPPELASALRDELADAMQKYQSGEPPALQTPSVEQVQKMMSVAVADQVPARYVPMLLEHMGLTVQGVASAQSIDLTKHQAQGDKFTAVIVGAGASGICAAIALGNAGVDYTIIEKNDDVGGTWNDNRYPGCAVDTPNHFYQFSFEPNNL